MKITTAVFGFLACLALPALTFAGSHDAKPTIHSTCCDEPARWAARHDSRDARLAITTEDGAATLLLTSEVAAVQLSDRMMRDTRRKLKAEKDGDEDNVLERAIKTAVIGGVRALLDHSAECPVRELKSVDYRDERLIFTALDGKRVFDDIDVNDRDVMTGFSERDAKAFVREFRRLKARSN
jgi:hypothetical protein